MRPAAQGDVAAVIAMQDRIFPGDPTRPSDEEFQARAQARDPYLTVVDVDGEVAGLFVLRDRAYRPWTSVDFFGVDDRFRGRGLAHVMMPALFANARRPIVRLFVRPSNGAARRVYAAHGLRHVSTRQASYPDGEDAMVLMRWIGAGFTPPR